MISEPDITEDITKLLRGMDEGAPPPCLCQEVPPHAEDRVVHGIRGPSSQAHGLPSLVHDASTGIVAQRSCPGSEHPHAVDTLLQEYSKSEFSQLMAP